MNLNPTEGDNRACALTLQSTEARDLQLDLLTSDDRLDPRC